MVEPWPKPAPHPPMSLRAMFLTLPPVVEELQVQILKLLLDNKDDNGVSDSQSPGWGPVGRDAALGLKTQRVGTGFGSHGRGWGKVHH